MPYIEMKSMPSTKYKGTCAQFNKSYNVHVLMPSRTFPVLSITGFKGEGGLNVKKNHSLIRVVES